jgi:hypothetical protein
MKLLILDALLFLVIVVLIAGAQKINEKIKKY